MCELEEKVTSKVTYTSTKEIKINRCHQYHAVKESAHDEEKLMGKENSILQGMIIPAHSDEVMASPDFDNDMNGKTTTTTTSTDDNTKQFTCEETTASAAHDDEPLLVALKTSEFDPSRKEAIAMDESSAKVLSSVEEEDVGDVRDVGNSWKTPVYDEATSGCREKNQNDEEMYVATSPVFSLADENSSAGTCMKNCGILPILHYFTCFKLTNRSPNTLKSIGEAWFRQETRKLVMWR